GAGFALSHGCLRRQREIQRQHILAANPGGKQSQHDRHASFVCEPIDIWFIGEVHGHGDAHDSNGYGDVHGGNRDAGNGHDQCGESHLQHLDAGGGIEFDHGFLRRGHKRQQQHILGANPDGKQNEYDRHASFIYEPIDIWFVGDVHGHGDAHDSNGYGDVHGGNRDAGNGHDQCGESHLQHLDAGGGIEFDHGFLRRGHKRQQQHILGANPDGKQNEYDRHASFIYEPIDIWFVGDVHGHGDAHDSDGYGDVHGGKRDAGNGHDQCGESNLQHLDAGGGIEFDHGFLWRGHKRQQQRVDDPDADGKQNEHD